MKKQLTLLMIGFAFVALPSVTFSQDTGRDKVPKTELVSAPASVDMNFAVTDNTFVIEAFQVDMINADFVTGMASNVEKISKESGNLYEANLPEKRRWCSYNKAVSLKHQTHSPIKEYPHISFVPIPVPRC